MTPDGSLPGSRDAAETRRRILAAATEEFAARGLAGARTATIAARASANQRMLYVYFGSKEGLFQAVIEAAVLDMRDVVELDPDDLTGYALAVFDAYREHTHLIRLALWQALEKPDLAETIEPVRAANEQKVEKIREAQREGRVSSALDAERLLDTILTIVYGNFVLSRGVDDFTAERRTSVGQAVTALLATPLQ